MDKAESIKFLLENRDAAEFIAQLDETTFWGTRLETCENTDYWENIVENSGIDKKEPGVYDISDFGDEDIENLLEGAKKVKESLEEGFELAYTTQHPSVKCGGCGNKWLQQRAGHISVAISSNGSSKSSYNCQRCDEPSPEKNLVYFEHINLAVAEGLEIYQTF